MAVKTWRCFHCNDVFTNPVHAAEHFGMNEGSTVACKLSISEGHLVTLIRKLQRELASYRAEDNLVLRAWLSKEAEHQQALRREEEKGYARGLADAKLLHQEAIDVAAYALATIPPNPDEPVTADWLREEWGFESEDDANGLIMIGTLDSHFEIELINIGDGWLVGGCINFPNGITTRHQFCQLATVLGLKPKQPTN